MLALLLSLQEVVPLNANNFDQYIQDHKYVLVKFFAPWCGHCQALAPKWIKLSEQTDIPVAEVDCTTQQSICGRFGVNGYPTIKMLSANETLDYQGPREAKDIKQWAEGIAKETFTVIEKENLKADVRERKLDAYFVLYSPESAFAEMEKAFKRYDGFFYYINSNESKLVAQQSGYQFTLKDLSNP